MNKATILPNSETGLFDVWHNGDVIWSEQNFSDAAIWANNQGYEVESVALAK